MSEKIEFDLTVPRDELNPSLKEASERAKNLESRLTDAVSVFAGNLLTKAFDKVISGLGDLVDIAGDSVDAASAQEVALNNMNASLARAGNYSIQASKDLQSFATAIQATTKFEDDAIQSSTALLQSLTNLNVEGLKKGISAATDFATVLGVDIETATRLVAKAANGAGEAFGRYGINVENAATKSETFERVLSKLNDNFGGAANSQLNTFNGSLVAMNNAYSDLLEPLGDIVVKNTLVVASFNAIKDILNGLNTDIANNNSSFKELVQDGIFATIAASQVLFDALDGITRVTKVVVNSIITIGDAIPLGIIEPFRLAFDAITSMLQQLPLIGDAFSNIQNPLDDFANSLRDKVVGGIQSVKEAAGDNIFTKLSDGAATFGERIIALSSEIEISSGVIKNSNAGRVVDEDDTNKQVLEKRAELNSQLAMLQDQYAADKITQDDQLALLDIDAGVNRDLAAIEALKEQKIREAQIIYDSEIEKANLLKGFENQELSRKVASYKKTLAITKASGEAELKEKATLAMFEQQLLNTRIAAAQGFLSAGISLAKDGSREQKILQTAQAVASTYTAATQALSSPPGPPYTIPLAASVVAQGLANVARINAVKFEHGGVVGGTKGATSGPDNTIAQIRTGEMILNAEQQEKLFSMINAGGSNSDIIIHVDGREIARAVRNQVRDGYKIA